jgi:DNA-binding CsgD family transcriptional regulator
VTGTVTGGARITARQMTRQPPYFAGRRAALGVARGRPPRSRPAARRRRCAAVRRPDFSEADRALLTLLRPHLYQAYLDAERRRHPVPDLTRRHWQLLELLAAGHTNGQIARRLGLSEGTVRKHLENIYGRLQVSSRTAAVTRAFPDTDPLGCGLPRSLDHLP